MELASIAFNERLRFAAVAAVCFAGIAMAAALPITVQEAYTFTHFVRPPVRDWVGAFDPANHVLETLLMKRSVGLLRLSAFSLRTPGLLGLALYLWAVARLAWSWPRIGWAIIAFAGAAYLGLAYCTPGTGLDLALALWLCAAAMRNLNFAGVCLGLSVAANFCFLAPALVLAVARLLRTRRFWAWADRVIVTAIVTAFLLLVLPFSHASARQLARLVIPPAIEIARSPGDLAGVIAKLRREARGRNVRIAASPDVAPVLEFYQARYREAGWRIVGFRDGADYDVIQTPGGGAVILAR